MRNEKNIGSLYNLRAETNFFDAAERLSEEIDLSKRIKILDELNVHDAHPIQINELLQEFCGDHPAIMNHLIKKNQDIFLHITDPDLEYMYIHDYRIRRDAQEDNKVKKDMIISLSDLYERKLILFKDLNLLQDPIREKTIVESEHALDLYVDLLEIFKYDRRTQETLNKIYPELYVNLKDKDTASRAIVDMLGNIISMELDYAKVIPLLKNTILELVTKDDWDSDDLSDIVREASYYVKRSIYSLVSIDDVMGFVLFIDELINDAHSEREIIILSGFLNYMNDIIDDSIGAKFSHKDNMTYTIIPMEELQKCMDTLENRDVEILHNSSSLEIEYISEVMNYYNEAFMGSDLAAKDMGKLNDSFIRILLKTRINSNMKQTLQLIDFYENQLTDNAINIVSVLQGLSRMVLEGLEYYRRDVLRKINTITTFKVTAFTKDGFYTDGETIDLLNYNNFKTKTIIHSVGNMDKIKNNMFDPESTDSNIKMMKAMYGIAEICGSSFNTERANAFHEHIKDALFGKLDKEVFMRMVMYYAFDLDSNDISYEKVYHLENINTIIDTPVLKKIDMGMMYECIRLKDDVEEVEEVELVDDSNIFELEDINLSDYNFDDLLTNDDVKIWHLNPFQILRQMKYNKLNLLTTSIHDQYLMYCIILGTLKRYEF